MKVSRLLGFAVLAIVFGCEGHQSPTAPGAVKSVPFDSTAVLSDGAHGGNPDFFFLPPLVPLPLNNSNFELGKFNNTLGPSLRIEICQLEPENNPTTHVKVLPVPHTQCVAGNPVTTFPAGSVKLVNLPVRQTGWWTAHHLPPDGFYYVLWDTRPPNLLDAGSYYRIRVFVDGNAIPMGFADVAPISNLWQWRSALTGQVIQLVNGWLLPIPFRIENGALCGGANSCTSKVVTNFDPSGFQYVTVDGGIGAIAGAKFPNGWLPAGGRQNVVVTISSVNTGPSDRTTGIQANPCHANLHLEQFDGCFKFTTTPPLPTQDNGKQFAKSVTVAVCYVLEGTGDPREKFAEMYASGLNEAPHALRDTLDVGILSAASRNCATAPPVVGSANQSSLMRLASSGWRKFTRGFGQLFRVKTAYAIDVGLGGLIDGFSNVGPAMPARIESYGSTEVTVAPGATTTISARIVGSNNHCILCAHADSGINRVPVAFSVGARNGTLSAATVTTSRLTIPGDFVTFVDGVASVAWTLPPEPGNYSMTADGLATGGPVTFTATVTGGVGGKPLYVANQGGANIKVFAAGVSGDATPTATITGGSSGGMGDPAGIALDGAGNIYVANASIDLIRVYGAGASGDAIPTATIGGPGNTAGVRTPRGVALDGAGNIYVANQGNSTITVYAPVANGNATLTGAIVGGNTGLSSPFGIARDGAGNIYVTNSDVNSITVYAAGERGNAIPTATITGGNTGLSSPAGIALDGVGNIYVANTSNSTVTVYAAGANGNETPTATITGGALFGPRGIALDGAGNIYVANFFGNNITVYTAGATGNATPRATISGGNTGLIQPQLITF